MSGGHWDYLSWKLDGRADDLYLLAGPLQLLAAIEHELDWGHSGDTCLDCARLRTIAALETFYDGGARGATVAIAVVRDGYQNMCPEDFEREKQRRKDHL